MELHQERVKEANEGLLWFVGLFAVMILMGGWMWLCEYDARRRVEAWARQEGFELVDFNFDRQLWDLFFLYVSGLIKVKDANGVVRTGSFSCAGGVLAILFRKVKVKWR